MTYFEFYDLPLSFRVDEAALRRTFLQNSRRYHPDFHTLADEARQAEMLDRSTLNNEVFKTLSDPDRRIRYVLELKGLLGDEHQQPALPQDFLMEMMDINENLMELEFDPDPERYAQTMAAVKTLETNLLAEVQHILDTYAEPFSPAADFKLHPDASGSNPQTSHSKLLAVRDYFLKRRYLLRILENLSKFAP